MLENHKHTQLYVVMLPGLRHSYIFKKFIFIFNLVHMCVAMCAHTCLQRLEESIRSPGAEHMGD